MTRPITATLLSFNLFCALTNAFSPSPSLTLASNQARSVCSSNILKSARNGEDELSGQRTEVAPLARRSFIQTTVAASLALLLTSGRPASAGIDPSALKSLPIEGDSTGAASRLRQIESANGPRPEDSKDIAFEQLPSGASYREYREGKGEVTIRPGARVAAEMTIRCRSFATANEPGGVKYFSTKEDTEFNELAWTVGSGELPPELEEAMMGMRKGGLRRIELPSTVVFAARKAEQLPLPSDKNKDGKRRFENLFKTDATLLFEVLVTRVK